jgi:6-phospho-3-hexuloisomerase
MNLNDQIRIDLEEISGLLAKTRVEDLEKICSLIAKAGAVFGVGQGRTGLVMKMFAMRLMQMGIETHVVGETTTPSIRAGDLLIAASGSGTTQGVVQVAAKAKALGANILVVTTDSSSPLAKLGDHCILLQAQSLKTHKDAATHLLLGSALEQSMLVLLDSLAVLIAHTLGEDNQTMMQRHANLE